MVLPFCLTRYNGIDKLLLITQDPMFALLGVLGTGPPDAQLAERQSKLAASDDAQVARHFEFDGRYEKGGTKT